MILPVEDEFHDVLSKAQKGQGLSTEKLAERCGLPEGAIRAARRGEFDAGAVRILGRELGLNVRALERLARGGWRPSEIGPIKGFAQVCSPFHDWQVNAYIVWDEEAGRAFAFDTGTTAEPMIERLEREGLELEALILTHAHWDHCEGAPDLKRRWPDLRVFQSRNGGRIAVPTEPIDEGFHLRIGRLAVNGFATPGHTADGMSFMVEGLDKSLAVVGDALFAGSMGGANDSYADALHSLERILALGSDTVLAPGHGPMTTVGEERAMNCFARG